jgi:hypothetical protein
MAATFQFSGGLIEVAALTALIGSTTAESLILGDYGAAGMPWAAMSSFGSLFLIKACIAAATPGWLRDTMGVRNGRCDDAVGLSLSLNQRSKRQGITDETVGVSVQVQKVSVYPYEASPLLNVCSTSTTPAKHSTHSPIRSAIITSTDTQQLHYELVRKLRKIPLCGFINTSSICIGTILTDDERKKIG